MQPREAKSDRAMKGIAVIVGFAVILVLLVTSGVLGGAICINNVGCLHSSGNGITIDNRESVTISTGNP
ncbi:MAG: hypothetical protein AB7N72_06280 [Thermoleophilia bacterium]